MSNFKLVITLIALYSTSLSYAQTGMKWIPAQGQTFLMGDIDTVSLSHSFWMDSTEVTQKLYDSVMAHNYSYRSTTAWNPIYGLGDSLPAYYVSWNDAVLFSNARSKLNGLDTVYSYDSIGGIPGASLGFYNLQTHWDKNGYRLPTESEWEFAARAGSSGLYSWDPQLSWINTNADSAAVNQYIVWSGNASQLAPVASKKPNSWGLYDMQGNAYEWTHDYYETLIGQRQTDPHGPVVAMGNVLRGGAWNKDLYYAHLHRRALAEADQRISFVSFRTVIQAPIQGTTVNQTKSTKVLPRKLILKNTDTHQDYYNLKGTQIPFKNTGLLLLGN